MHGRGCATHLLSVSTLSNELDACLACLEKTLLFATGRKSSGRTVNAGKILAKITDGDDAGVSPTYGGGV